MIWPTATVALPVTSTDNYALRAASNASCTKRKRQSAPPSGVKGRFNPRTRGLLAASTNSAHTHPPHTLPRERRLPGDLMGLKLVQQGRTGSISTLIFLGGMPLCTTSRNSGGHFVHVDHCRNMREEGAPPQLHKTFRTPTRYLESLVSQCKNAPFLEDLAEDFEHVLNVELPTRVSPRSSKGRSTASLAV